MCYRYFLEESQEVQAIAEELDRSPLIRKWLATEAVLRFGEIRPESVAPVIAPSRDGRRAVFPMRWGYREKSLITSARTDNAPANPIFREDWKKHRCVIPASWYYEVEHRRGNDGKTHNGDIYMLQPKDSTMTWMCGLYRIERGLPFFVVLTRNAPREIRFINDRMPLLLPEELVPEWIRPDSNPEAFLSRALTDMFYEKASKTNRFYERRNMQDTPS